MNVAHALYRWRLISVAALALGCDLSALSADLSGTWKLNLTKSKLQSEYSTEVVKIELSASGAYRFTYDLVMKHGQKSHSEVVRNFDGQKQPMPGGSDAYEIDEHPDSLTWTATRFVNGEMLDRRRAVLSSDNKSHTVHRTSRDRDGKTIEEILVFDRQ